MLARFSASQVVNVVQHGQKLVVFRSEYDPANPTTTTQTTQVLVYDMSSPATPRLAGSVRTTLNVYPYYWYFCGVGYWDGYWWGQGDSRWTSTANGMVFLNAGWDSVGQKQTWQLAELDLSDITTPVVRESPLPVRPNTYFMGLAPDAADPNGFFLTSFETLGEVQQGTYRLTRTRYFAERFRRGVLGWDSEGAVNLPGHLIKSWRNGAGNRLYLSSDSIGYETADTQGNKYWTTDTRLHLLQGLATGAAELRSSYRFEGRYLSDVVVSGETLFANIGTGYYFGRGFYPTGVGGPAIRGGLVTTRRGALTVEEASDHLVAFDMKAVTLNRVYDQPTGTYGVQLMGTHRGLLMVNLPGDGLLAVDVTDPTKPAGRQFLRTLGWASHAAFSGSNVYVGSGYFGTYRMNLAAPSLIPVHN